MTYKRVLAEMQVRWSATELLSRKGFNDGMFATTYAQRGGLIVSPSECAGRAHATMGQGAFAEGDDYPDYVLCLVDELRARSVGYIVLQDPEVGSHNVDTIQSFVWRGKLYVVMPRDSNWITMIPDEVRQTFQEAAVTVQIDDDESG